MATIRYHYGEAYKTLRETEEYRPGARDYYVRQLNDRRNEFLLASISPSFRKDWFDSHRTSEKETHCMIPIFDEISASAKKTLPNYQPRGYIQHDSGEEELIRNAVKEELADAQFIDVGVSSPPGTSRSTTTASPAPATSTAWRG